MWKLPISLEFTQLSNIIKKLNEVWGYRVMIKVLDKIKNCIVELNLEGIGEAVKEALKLGISPYAVLMDGMAEGMKDIGKKYEAGEYFLSELIAAGEVMKEGMKVLEPKLKLQDIKEKGVIVIGTVKGDLHDIGKNVVAMLLKSAGFKVFDLGVDVSPEKFVKEAKIRNAHIIAISALLTTTMLEIGNVIKALNQAGIRNKVKVIVGGAALTKDFAEKIGADAYGKDAVESVKICESWAKTA
jgi:5-methyltetrahydrofolate--homocysteine methyltransferase